MQTVEEILGRKQEEQLTVESIIGTQPLVPIKDIGLIPSHRSYQPEPPPFKMDG